MSNASVRIELQPEKLTKEAYFYAIEAAYIEHDFEDVSEDEKKNAYLILLVKAGGGKLVYGKTEYNLKARHLIYINCKNKYSFKADKEGWDVLYLYFNGKQARGNYKAITQKQSSPIYYIENDSMIHSLIWQVISAHRNKDGNAEALTSLNITKLLTEMYNMREPNNEYNSDFPICVHYVFHYVAHNYSNKITLDMIAKKYAVSKFHISREFKRYSGMTVNEYIVSTRIRHAKNLLRHSDKSVEHIALGTGFPSSSHFIKVFKEYEGITPGMYRKQ